MTTTYQLSDLQLRYQELTGSMACECEMAMELVGGQPAERDGILAFVRHHLNITDEAEAKAAANRIMSEEVGERDIAPAEGELAEKRVYGVNVLRRSAFGPWIGCWQVKACIKQAASRLGIFMQQRGSKGNFAEAGQVEATGISLCERDHPERIYLRTPHKPGTANSEVNVFLGDQGLAPASTAFREFRGRVSTPKGSVSIIHHSECAPAGTFFDFIFRFLPGKLKAEDLRDVAAMMMIMGLGSVRSLELGKFRILTCKVEMP